MDDNKKRALSAALTQIERQFGKGAIMRLGTDDSLDVEGISLAETALELVLADAIVRSQGGTMTASTADSREIVILIDLPA